MAIFDRFVRYQWAEHALELAIKKEEPRTLQGWLVGQGLGKESARRTSNLLTHLWFDIGSSKSSIRTDALEIFPIIEPTEQLALHWGMAIAQFPVFRETAQVIGRLGHLQEEFNKTEVISRVLEKHSNQTTVRRAVERVVQTLTDWSVIKFRSKSRYCIHKSHSIISPALAEWLFRAIMIGEPEKYWLVSDLLGASEIFPFDLAGHGILLYRSSHMHIVRDSAGAEIVGVQVN
ncbi:MAG: hypothetical protein QY302_08705 [Anaerolineales bacterium]|nr:MAG: hypothetical protein QY302_08705 [Anaerolineales bacterium]GER78902.1 conserved hypothetical protein [Candidatus Denitrolinea symbiosum]